MTKPKDLATFMAALDHPEKAAIERLRGLIVSAAPGISEGVKWNAPSFFCREWFATIHLRARDGVQIILHRGAKARDAMTPVADPDGLLQWLDSNRASVKLEGLAEIDARQAALTALIAAWVAQV